MPYAPQLADVLLVRGTGWLADEICRVTDAPVNHAGLVTAVRPLPQITEAKNRVLTRPLEVSIADAEGAWLMHDPRLTDWERWYAVKTMLTESADSYGYLDLVWQLFDATFHTEWFTEHAARRLVKRPICSFAVAHAMEAVGQPYDKPACNVTPGDIWRFGWEREFQFERVR